MKTLSNLYIVLLAINCLALFIAYSQYSSSSETKRVLSASEHKDLGASGHNVEYQFDDPTIAYEILKQLDVFVPLEGELTQREYESRFSEHLLGTKPNHEYCDNHRALFTENTDIIFKEKNIMTSFVPATDLRKRVIPAIGGRDYSQHASAADREKNGLSELKTDITTFFIFAAFSKRQIGRQFSCTTQMSNHIPGHDSLYRKDRVGERLAEYTKLYDTRPQCLNSEKFFPQTWALRNEEQCKDFFAEFNSPRYKELKKERKIVYFRKVGSGLHQGKGVFPVDNAEEKKVREQYQNGALCGKINNNHIMQYFVHNPLLINGKKFDFRVMILIASTNPTIVYFHDGYLRISMLEFDPESGGKGSLLTNLSPVEHLFGIAKRNGTYNGQTEKEMRESVVWNLTRFQSYLLEEGIIQDPNWLDNHFKPELQRMIIHLIRMTQEPFAQRSSLFEIFGLDLMLDSDLNMWFIEANANVGLQGTFDVSKTIIKKLLIDGFEVLYGLLRSRTKRIVNYVNNLARTGQAWQDEGSEEVHIEDLEAKRAEFQELIKNYFEPEFEPSESNGLVKIVDENYSGVKRYNYLISEECL